MAGIVVGSAGAASAGYADCPSGKACIWGDANYATSGIGTAHLSFFYSYKYFYLGTYAGTAINGNNTATSVTNNGNLENADFYRDDACAYYLFTLQPGGERDPNLGTNPGIDTRTNAPLTAAQVNNTLSSGKFTNQACNP